MDFNESYTDFNFSNASFESFPNSSHQPWMKTFRSLVAVYMMSLQVLLQLSVGCNITWNDILQIFKRPLPISVGMFCQFILLPLITCIVVLVAKIDNAYSAGFIVLASVPGGAISNTLTYIFNGDLPLSISMTFLATVMSNVMIPTNLWIYGRQFESTTFVIPYKNIAYSLLMITIPLLLGMLLRWKYPRFSQCIIKTGSTIGLIMILIYIIVESVISPQIYTSLPVIVIVIATTLPLLIFTVTCSVAYLLRFNMALCKAMSIECCSQNISLCIAIFTLSFPVETILKFLGMPFMYGLGIWAAMAVAGVFEGLQRTIRYYSVDSKEKEFLGEGIDESVTKFLNHDHA